MNSGRMAMMTLFKAPQQALNKMSCWTSPRSLTPIAEACSPPFVMMSQEKKVRRQISQQENKYNQNKNPP